MIFLWNLFLPKRMPTVLVDVDVDRGPYRDLHPEPPHDSINCDDCKWLKKNAVWKPPEVILTAGFHAECLMKSYGMTMEELDQLAVRCGLKKL